ncbi:hypothetical protein GF342_02265 [Candidatus Woesearchaeota archaeon]|nr:hypothetical protein [Candidatus Woesearchaeota archaeon]
MELTKDTVRYTLRRCGFPLFGTEGTGGEYIGVEDLIVGSPIVQKSQDILKDF